MPTVSTTGDVKRTSTSSPELVPEAETLLRELTTRQHLRPHRRLREVLGDIRACPVAAERAFEWLGLDGDGAVGRVKRTELIQLARSLHRIWKRARAAASPDT